MVIKQVWIVQDRDSGLFLAPFQGDVGYVRSIADAGQFDDYPSAQDTAQFHIGHLAIIFNFYIKVKNG